jgi:uncharacterized protein (TIGR04255 family)
MAERRHPTPAKLKNDAIVEAVLEVRFDMPTRTIPEIFFGRLAEHDPWKGFDQHPLPASQIPAPLRQADPNLRYQAVFELAAPDRRRTIRVGSQVLSYHRLSPYVGWKEFKPELEQAVDGLFSKAGGVTIRRLGLRYMNALRADLHGIKSIADLDLKLLIAGETVSGNVNVNFTTDVAPGIDCTVRVATAEFVQGVLPPNTSVYIDVDVFTEEGFKTKDEGEVKRWIELAHTKEKEEFFHLLTANTIEKLEER